VRKLYVSNLSEGEVNVGGVNVPLPDALAIKQNWRNAPSIGMGHALVPGNGEVRVIQTLSTIPQNAPTAVINLTYSNNIVQLNGLSSFDTDGVIVGYAWSFSPAASGSWTSGTANTAIAEFTLDAPYTGLVELTVTDNALLTGSTSETVERTLVITQQPVSATVAAPSTHTFTVAASTNFGVPTYQWYSGDGEIVGATSSSYTTPATTYTGNSIEYHCVVSNGYFQLSSTSAYLSVLPALPLVWLKFDTSGTTTPNYGSFGGTVTGPTATFDGSSKLTLPLNHTKSITLPSLTSRFRQVPITWMGWFKPYLRGTPGGQGNIQIYPPNAISNDVFSYGGYGIGLNVWSAGNEVKAGDATVAVTVAADTWYHMVGVSTVGGTDVYVNGVYATHSSYIVTDGRSSSLYVGRHNDDSGYGEKRFWFGEMADVRIYAAALDAETISTLYAESDHPA